MNSLVTFNNNQSPMIGNGKQLLGYLGTFSQDLGSTGNPYCYVSLVDIHNQTQYQEIDFRIYEELCERYRTIQLENDEKNYVWVEVNEQGMVINWRLFKTTLFLAQLYPIYQACYDFISLYQLIELVESIRSIPLRMFMRLVLADTELMIGFVSLPASRRHHHSFPGGLLMHSLECAFITKLNVDSLVNLSRNEKEVATVAAVLHDIGKVKTLGAESHTSLGRLLDHEEFTLSVLAESLKALNDYWPLGAEVLQYLLLWNESKGYCRYVSGNAIKMADRMSTSASISYMAFENKPKYYSYSFIEVGSNKVFSNRLN